MVDHALTYILWQRDRYSGHSLPSSVFWMYGKLPPIEDLTRGIVSAIRGSDFPITPLLQGPLQDRTQDLPFNDSVCLLVFSPLVGDLGTRIVLR